MIKEVQNVLTNSISNYPTKKYLLAVSGGVDSMVLLHIFQQLNVSFSVAHCNFNLRDDESEMETQFVKKYCSDHSIELYVKYFDTIGYSNSSKVSIQIAARELRYKWFAEILEKESLDFIVTAHHLNDQIETFFINTLRATSVNGLRGIPQITENMIRPLLQFSRFEIVDFAHDNKIIWKEDSSNASTKYIRNKIRHEVVPVLEELNPNLYDSFSNLFMHLEEDYFLKLEGIRSLANQFCSEENEIVKIDWDRLKNNPDNLLILKHLVLPYGFKNNKELRKFVCAQIGKSIYSDDYEMLKDRNCFLIRKQSFGSVSKNVVFVKNDEENEIISLIFGNSFLETIPEEKRDVTLDASFMLQPFSVRKPNEGDYFYPLGMKGKKKISKFMKDCKLSKFQKENIWLLVDSNDDIVWVIGYQIDDRFKVNEQTQKTIKFIAK